MSETPKGRTKSTGVEGAASTGRPRIRPAESQMEDEADASIGDGEYPR